MKFHGCDYDYVCGSCSFNFFGWYGWTVEHSWSFIDAMNELLEKLKGFKKRYLLTNKILLIGSAMKQRFSIDCRLVRRLWNVFFFFFFLGFFFFFKIYFNFFLFFFFCLWIGKKILDCFFFFFFFREYIWLLIIS